MLDALLDNYSTLIANVGWPPEIVPAELSVGTQAERDAYVARMACQIIRVERLMGPLPCAIAGTCPEQSSNPNIRKAVERAEAAGACERERTAPPDDLIPTEEWPLAADPPAE